MDCDTTVIFNTNSLSRDELIDEYELLSFTYINEKKSNEKTIEELKSNVRTAQDTASFLLTELYRFCTVIDSKHIDEIDDYKNKLELLQKQYDEVKELNTNQESELAAKWETIESLKLQLQEYSNKSNPNVSPNRQGENCSPSEELLKETNTLNDKNESKIADLMEQCQCLTATLATKRNELREKNDLYEALQEKVCALNLAYTNEKKSNEYLQQTIHELKSNLQTAQNAESFLSTELDAIQSNHSKEIDKYKNELEIHRKRHADAKELNGMQESDLAKKQAKIECLELQLQEQSNKSNPIDSLIRREEINGYKELLEELNALKAKYDKLYESQHIMQERLQSELIAKVQNEAKIAILMEQCECLTENLATKRNELEEKNDLYEELQEKVCALNCELASLKNNPDLGGKRGNSLFAEVDDQRQQMKQLLANQKKHYLQMKKDFSDCQQLIVRLKHEKQILIADMHTQLERCRSTILNGRQEFETKLNDKIFQLKQENKSLENKLKMYEEKLILTAKQHGVTWLDSMLEYCNQERKTLKDNLWSVSLKQTDSDGQLMRTQEEMAKWRFEALKSRCIIANREALLKDNQISFDPLSSDLLQIQNFKLSPSSPTKPLLVDDNDDKENVIVLKKSPPEFVKRKILHDSTQNNSIFMKCSPPVDFPKPINKQVVATSMEVDRKSLSDMEETICIPTKSDGINTVKSSIVNESLMECSPVDIPKPINKQLSTMKVDLESLSDMEETICIPKLTPVNKITAQPIVVNSSVTKTPKPVYRKLAITPQRVAQLNRFAAAALKPSSTKRSILLNNARMANDGVAAAAGLESVKKCVNFSNATKQQKCETDEKSNANGETSKMTKKFVLKKIHIKSKKPTEW